MTGSINKLNVLQGTKVAYAGAFKSFLPAGLLMVGYMFMGMLSLYAIGSLFPGTLSLAKYVSILCFAIGLVSAIYYTQQRSLGLDPVLNPLKTLKSMRFWTFFLSFFIVIGSVIAVAFSIFQIIQLGWEVNFQNIEFDFKKNAGFDFKIVAGLASFWLSCFVCFRLFLVLPEVAAGGRISFKKSWRAMNSNSMKLGLVLFFAMFPINLFNTAIRIFAQLQSPTSLLFMCLMGLVVLTLIGQVVMYASVGGAVWKALNQSDTEEVASET